MDTIANLIVEYDVWCKEHGVDEPMCAEELLASDRWELDLAERQWLRLFIERWDFAQAYETATFVEVFEAWMEHKAKGPDESSGYTDKAWCRQRARFEDRINAFFAKETT